MKINFIVLCALVVLSFTACKKEKEAKTPSGYSYTNSHTGSGDAAKAGDFVSFTAQVVGEDGKVLQEMAEGPQMPIIEIPAEMPKGKEANPIMEVLLGAKVGDTLSLTFPVDSMPQPPMDIAAMKYVKYNLVVKKLQSKEEFEATKAKMQEEQSALAAANAAKLPAIEELIKTNLADYKANKLSLKTSPSGLKYYILKEGQGAKAEAGKTVAVQYYGNLMDGKKFDESFSRGAPIEFPLGQGRVIPGWDEGIALLNKGSKAFFFIPSALAYGEAGSPPMIPANSELMFYVELEDIK
jgi:FKBP-type peptidyl-prolyl cis-trans isomerase FkpA